MMLPHLRFTSAWDQAVESRDIWHTVRQATQLVGCGSEQARLKRRWGTERCVLNVTAIPVQPRTKTISSKVILVVTARKNSSAMEKEGSADIGDHRRPQARC